MQYKLQITVKEVKGICELGHKVGDVIEFNGPFQKGFLCPQAYAALQPFIYVMRFGGEVPWERDKNKASFCCSDHRNPVIFEIERLERLAERKYKWDEKGNVIGWEPGEY